MLGRIISWNVRGINDPKKRQLIIGGLRKWKPDIVCLQEIKMECMNDHIVWSLWSSRGIRYYYNPVVEIARGIIILWKKSQFSCNDCFAGKYMLSCIFRDGRSGTWWLFSGIYNKREGNERKTLWDDLEECRSRWKGPWEVGRDFNMILHKSERSGDQFSAKCADEFKEIVDRLGLMDLPLVGGRWTWSNLRQNLVCSSIGRCLVSYDCQSIASNLYQKCLSRFALDHFPICLEANG